MRPFLLVLVLTSFALGQSDANAIRAVQPVPKPAGHSTPMNEFGLWTEYSPTSIEYLGISRDRSFSKVAARYGRRVFTTHWIAMKYTLDLVPLAILRQP